MGTATKRASLFQSAEGAAIEQSLKEMLTDRTLKTESSYTANVAIYHDNVMPFVKKHMTYLDTHPKVNPQHYLANLRLMIKIRS